MKNQKSERKTSSISSDIENSALKLGIVSGFIASLCCVGPLVLVLLGIGSASGVLAISSRKIYFLLFGIFIFYIDCWTFLSLPKKLLPA